MVLLISIHLYYIHVCVYIYYVCVCLSGYMSAYNYVSMNLMWGENKII